MYSMFRGVAAGNIARRRSPRDAMTDPPAKE